MLTFLASCLEISFTRFPFVRLRSLRQFSVTGYALHLVVECLVGRVLPIPMVTMSIISNGFQNGTSRFLWHRKKHSSRGRFLSVQFATSKTVLSSSPEQVDKWILIRILSPKRLREESNLVTCHTNLVLHNPAVSIWESSIWHKCHALSRIPKKTSCWDQRSELKWHPKDDKSEEIIYYKTHINSSYLTMSEVKSAGSTCRQWWSRFSVANLQVGSPRYSRAWTVLGDGICTLAESRRHNRHRPSVLYLTLQDHLTFRDLTRPAANVQIRLIVSSVRMSGQWWLAQCQPHFTINHYLPHFLVNEKHPTRVSIDSMCHAKPNVSPEIPLSTAQSIGIPAQNVALRFVCINPGNLPWVGNQDKITRKLWWKKLKVVAPTSISTLSQLQLSIFVTRDMRILCLHTLRFWVEKSHAQDTNRSCRYLRYPEVLPALPDHLNTWPAVTSVIHLPSTVPACIMGVMPVPPAIIPTCFTVMVFPGNLKVPRPRYSLTPKGP